jgi:hypothetical protein
VNLFERFGGVYRIDYEPQRGQWPRTEWAWLMRIVCRYGLAYPYGGDLLQAVTSRRKIGARLQRLPFVVHSKGGTEVVVRFHVEHVEEVLAILRPYRRRQLSEQRKASLAAIGRAALAEYRARANVQSEFLARRSTQAGGCMASHADDNREGSSRLELDRSVATSHRTGGGRTIGRRLGTSTVDAAEAAADHRPSDAQTGTDATRGRRSRSLDVRQR